MTIYAGQILSAQRVAALQPQTYHVAANSDLVLSGTLTDVPGATYTFDTIYPNAKAIVTWTCDFDSTNTTAATGIAHLNVDGVDVTTPQALSEQGTANDERGTRGQQAEVILATAGSHTIKLRGQRASGSGGMEINATHSTMSIVVTEVV